jgi:nuclear pore complex protein Nup62
MYICVWNVSIYVCKYGCMDLWICGGMHARVYICMYVCVYICMYVYICVYVCMYVCVCMYVLT